VGTLLTGSAIALALAGPDGPGALLSAVPLVALFTLVVIRQVISGVVQPPRVDRTRPLDIAIVPLAIVSVVIMAGRLGGVLL
jgi:hypothetical protein